ncbi:hypothetical protein D3C87_1019500 [compost metagenome]
MVKLSSGEGAGMGCQLRSRTLRSCSVTWSTVGAALGGMLPLMVMPPRPNDVRNSCSTAGVARK